jgi:DNA helicase HerA-like ATPase
VIVIACLEDFYEQLRSSLAQPLLDRLEHDPGKVRLESSRTAEEIAELVACRLEVLYDEAGVSIDRDDRTFPIPIESLRERQHQRTRDVLRWCGQFQEEYRQFGEPPADRLEIAELPATGPVVGLDLSEAWHAFQADHQGLVPADEAWRAQILATAVGRANDELPPGGPVFEANVDGRFIELEQHAADNSVRKTLAAVCDRLPHGGALARQVTELEKNAGENGRFIVRSMEFPSNPATKIAKLLGDFLMRGGRRAVFEDAHWRQMLAWEEFRKLHHERGDFAAWLRAEQPLTHIKPLGELLDLNHHGRSPQSPAVPLVEPAPLGRNEVAINGRQPSPTANPALVAMPLRLGTRVGLDPAPVEMLPEELTRHAAFLGGSGSGKTTVALNLIEQLLERGVSAVLIDRKGDLCGYADPAWWAAPAADAAATARKLALRKSIDVALFTPGASRGRPLRLSIVPPGISESKDFEQLAQAAASALASMIKLDSESRHGPQRAILLQAVRQLALMRPKGESGVEELIELLDSHDPSLINAIGRLEANHFKKLIDGLEVLRLTRGELLDASAERLDLDRVVGQDAAGRTRLTIISTKFLGDQTDVRFWVAQFLNELRRWASKNPAAGLQLACLLDEADIYLPATSQPPTKPPMEDLLKRGRSAGIGLLLATQSPGDLDYKCRENIRSWFLGRIKETTALAKLKPLLASAPFDVSSKLPGQATGEFHWLRDGAVASLRAAPSLMTTEQRSEDEILRLAAAGH